MKNQPVENIRVIGLGQASLDHLGRVSAFPGEDEKAELLDIHKQSGGPASTAMVTLSRLGIGTSFMGSISDDHIGLEILKGLEKDMIDHRLLKIIPGYTSQYAFIAITRDNGKRTIFWHRGSVPQLKPEDVDLNSFPKAEILHVDGLMIEASMEAATQAKEMGLKVVMDAGTMRKGSMDLVSLVDVLIASERFVCSIVDNKNSYEKALKLLYKSGPKIVIITMGSEGSIGWDGGKTGFQPAYPVSAVDTTGAGDVYHGAYIYGLLEKWDMKDCMRFASAIAAMKCQKIGARQGIPSIEEVNAFMGQFPFHT